MANKRLSLEEIGEQAGDSCPVGTNMQRRRNIGEIRLALGLAISFGALAMLAGCGGRHSPAGFRLPENGDVERGKTAFVELGCHQCHPVAGVDLPQPPGDSEVSLQLGGRVYEVRTDGYLVTSIIHPSHRIRRLPDIPSSAESPMPDYTEQMTVRQLIDIVALLQSRYEVEPPPTVMY